MWSAVMQINLGFELFGTILREDLITSVQENGSICLKWYSFKPFALSSYFKFTHAGM